MNPTAISFSAWRAMSPGDALRTAYAAIRAYADPALFITLRPEAEALELAKELEAKGPAGLALFGLPFVVKDNIDVAGLPTTAACPAFAYKPETSAFVVARLEAAGAICIGKANLDQFATGLVGVRSPYGVPRNSLRADLVPGGSSSGSAVSVGAGIAAFSLGTDTAGSGRVPAALNGIVGLKPSLGLFSATGVVPACRSLDTISVFASTVADAAEVAAVAQAHDPDDFMSRSLPLAGVAAVPPRFVVGVPRKAQRVFCGDALAEAAYDGDIATLETAGAVLREIDFDPLFAVARLLYEGPWVAERYHAVKALIETNPDALHPVTRTIIGGATRFTAVDGFDASYKLARLRQEAKALLTGIDMLAVPTIPTVYTVAELQADPIRLNSNLGTYTNFVNLLDMCAFSVPVGMRDDGLPSSITLIARAGQDAVIAGVAAVLEGKPAAPTTIAPDHVRVAVVGAHLSGMPLNRELTDRAARFDRAARTTADYRLYALAGTVPPKPGLMRVTDRTGTSIAVEVWTMPVTAYGSFVAGIPSPLGIGTLRLDDGTSVQGFLVESEAIKGAEDISSHGGWRAYMASRKA